MVESTAESSISYKGLLVLVAILLSAAAYCLASGIFANPYLGLIMWLAPLPILLYAYSNKVISAALVSFFGLLAGNLATLYILGQRLPGMLSPFTPDMMLVLGAITSSFIFTTGIMVSRYLVQRRVLWWNCLFLPAFWTGYEYLHAMTSPSATNDSIAYSQLGWPHVNHIATFTGMWGITFLLVLLPAGLACAWHYRKHRYHAIICLLIPLIIIGENLVFSNGQLQTRGPSIRVGVAAIDTSIVGLRETGADHALEVAAQYNTLVHQLAEQGAQVVLLPEKVLRATPDYSYRVMQAFSNIARTNMVMLIVGVDREFPPKGFNSAYAFLPNGNFAAVYNKHFLVKFSSEANYQSGHNLGFISFLNHQFGLAICHDFDFQNYIRQYSKHQIGLMFDPALDFIADARLHIEPALMRSIENGFSLVRAAQWGKLSISNYHGEVIKQASTSLSHPTAIIGDVPIGPGQTYYSRHGDWFAWAAIALGLIVFIGVLLLPAEGE